MLNFSRQSIALSVFMRAAGGAWAADLPSTSSPPAYQAPASSIFLFEDTTVSYKHEFTAHEPGVTVNGLVNGPAPTFPKEVATVTHVDAWAYGTNFLNVDTLFSPSADPAAPAIDSYTGAGAIEVYALYRGTLSGNALSNSKQFSYGIIKDISIGFGGDIGTKDTYFAPRKRDLVVGPQVSLDVPGYFTIQANFYKEWNHNAFGSPDVYSDFHPTGEFEMTYMQPLDKYVGGLPLSFSGFANFVLPKGSGNTGSFNDTRTEILTSNQLSLDVSKYFGLKQHFVDAFVGYQFWYNKFGANHQTVSGAIENTVFIGTTFHVL
jgi:nucleoside-specific outer membrane channel protein Tsx